MKPQAKRSVRRLWLLLLLILGLPAAYVLSLGPVAFVWNTFHLPLPARVSNALVAFYAPIGRIPKDSAMGKARDYYISLWIPGE